MTKQSEPDVRSPLLPTDAFDQQLAALVGLPNGSNTRPAVEQTQDAYGNVTSWMVQTVKTDQGEFAFLSVVTSAGSQRFVIPPRVLAVMDRQRQSCMTMVRRKTGVRVAAERLARGDDPARFLRRGRKA